MAKTLEMNLKLKAGYRHQSRRVLLSVVLILLAALPLLVSADDAPTQKWEFGAEYRAATGGLKGTVVGKLEPIETDGLRCMRLTPGESGSGILLTQDAKQANLPAGPMTVEAWVQLELTQAWGGILGAVYDTGTREAGWVLGYRDNRFCFGLTTAQIKRITYLNSETPFVLNAWYHVVATYDGTGIQRLYVDGKLDAESKVQRGPILQPDPLFYTIGAYRDDNDHFPFSGKLAEISVWHRQLSAEEIGSRFAARNTQFPGIEGAAPNPLAAEDSWPTWRGNNERNGRSSHNVDLHPSAKPLWVYRPNRKPAPAWPETALSDHWRKRTTPENPKSTFDWVHDVAVAEGKVFFGSSATDVVRCLDAQTGEVSWEFIAGGPVRLAPTVSEGRVVFGCDDGAVYCLSAVDGSLSWKAKPREIEDRRLPGNGRLMSVWPVRTGVLDRGDTGYFGVGLFPKEGAWYCTVDLRDGRIIDQKPVGFSPQGYISEKDGQLMADPGRTKEKPRLGAVNTGQKPNKNAKLATAAKFAAPVAALTTVETPELLIAGREKSVAAFERQSGLIAWEAEVDAPARGLAVAGGQLFVSTMSGAIYAFGPQAGEADSQRPTNKPTKLVGPSIQIADDLIAKLPRKRGYALVIGVADGSLLRAIAERSQLHVVGVDTDPNRIAQVRRDLAAQGVYGAGGVVIQEVASYDELPYVDGIFNLITVGENPVQTPISEVKRLLRPWDGIAVLGPGEEIRAAAPVGAGSWTHAYANGGNTAASGDKLVNGEISLRWFGRPGPEKMVDRHLRASPPLAAGGFLIVPGRDHLFGLDAHNGTVLWEKEIPNFMRASMLRDCGNLALDSKAKRVFATSGATCLSIDANTGDVRREFSVDANSEEWGFVAVAGEALIGSAVVMGAIRRELSYKAIWEGGYGDGKRAVCSRRLFALDPESGAERWSYTPKGAIANPSICFDQDRIIFLESRNAETLKSPGRWHYPDLMSKAGAELVALDLATGKPMWHRPLQVEAKGIQSLYLSTADGHLAMVYSQNAVPEGAMRETLHYAMRMMKAEDGSLVWEDRFDTAKRTNLTHGEQDFHPVIVDDHLVVQTRVYSLTTGEALFTFKKGYGCGTLSASSSKLYYRSSHPAQFDLQSRRESRITSTTRPGCWINMIPANGLLLVPEGSSGCICSFPVQASMAFGVRE